jgi:hypothetical protein
MQRERELLAGFFTQSSRCMKFQWKCSGIFMPENVSYRVAETKQFLGGFASEQFRHAFLFEIFGAKTSKQGAASEPSEQASHTIHTNTAPPDCQATSHTLIRSFIHSSTLHPPLQFIAPIVR